MALIDFLIQLSAIWRSRTMYIKPAGMSIDTYTSPQMQVFEWVMCSEAKKDSHRFMDMIEAGIAQGELKRYKAFTAWGKDMAAKPRPKNPLAKPKKMKKAGASQLDEQALVAAIR